MCWVILGVMLWEILSEANAWRLPAHDCIVVLQADRHLIQHLAMMAGHDHILSSNSHSAEASSAASDHS